MYKRVNDFKGYHKKKKRFLKGADGILITFVKEIANKKMGKILAQTAKMLNEKFSFNIRQINTQECPNPTLEEIKIKVQRLKNPQGRNMYKRCS